VAINGVQVIQAGLACCGVEASAADLVANSGTQIIQPGQPANILVVAGTVTKALAPVVKTAYENLSEPKIVVAFGVCAITGGPYWDSYSVLPGAQEVIPVDINVPGCPPTPEVLASALTKAMELVK
jgi:NADH-quinone oxidoreductase subunit B